MAEQPVRPAGGRPRKPKIEVLQPRQSSAPVPPEGTIDNEEPRSGTVEDSRAGTSKFISRRHRPPSTAAGRRGGGLFSSRTLLSVLMTLGALALLFGYIDAERDRQADFKATEAAMQAEASADRASDRSKESGAGNPNGAGTVIGLEERLIAEHAELKPAVRPEARPPAETTRTADFQRSTEAIEPRRAPEADELRSAPEGARIRSARSASAAPRQGPPVERPIRPGDDDGPVEPNALATVRDFYLALSDGDGDSASRLVVPGKRRSGPLSAGALTRYFSSFRRPLRVRHITVLDESTVEAAYEYVLSDGRVCRGRALVDVVRIGGEALISRIRTRGPC